MKNTLTRLCLLVVLLNAPSIYAQSQTFQVKQDDIYRGYISEKIWLENYALPAVAISDITYESATLPPKSTVGNP